MNNRSAEFNKIAAQAGKRHFEPWGAKVQDKKTSNAAPPSSF
jgi:hypothetical protein